MSCKNLVHVKTTLIWPSLVAASFVLCGLLVYLIQFHYGTNCSESSGCSSSSTIKADRLINGKCTNICTTKECVLIANTIMDLMNPNADPCEDFFDFACGGYLEGYGERENISVTIFNSLNHQLFRITKDLIETSEETHYAGSAAQKLKIVYDSCLDTKSSELNALESLTAFLHEIGIKNWPQLDSNFAFSDPTLEDVLGRLITFGSSFLFDFETTFEHIKRLQSTGQPYNSTINYFAFSHYKRKVEDKKQLVASILQQVGLDHEDIGNTWDDFLSVNYALKKLKDEVFTEEISNETEDCNSDKEDEDFNCNQDDDQDEENFVEYLACNPEENEYLDCSQEDGRKNMYCKILASVVKYGNLTSSVATTGLFLSCSSAPYIKGLPNILNSFSHKTLAHFISVITIINNLEYMSFPTRKTYRGLVTTEKDEYSRYLQELNRWKFCADWITMHMTLPVGHLYVDNMITQKALNDIEHIVEIFKAETAKSIQAQDRLSTKAKISLSEQMENTDNDTLGYLGLNMYKNRTFINGLYENFQPSRNSFFTNVMNIKKNQFIVSKSEYEVMVMRYYKQYFRASASSSHPNVHVSFGMILPPIYRYGNPLFFNVAQLGKVIGHEIGHNLDFWLRAVSKSDNETRLYYEENNECLIEQYFGYEVKRIGKNIRGNYTRSENFADEISIEVAEQIVKKFLDDEKDAKVNLPGLNFSPEQLFYITSSQAFCGERSLEDERKRYDVDSHPPLEFRVKGVLHNSKRFSEVFNCPIESPMNPQKKCHLFH